jgi:hypothetical protein
MGACGQGGELQACEMAGVPPSRLLWAHPCRLKKWYFKDRVCLVFLEENVLFLYYLMELWPKTVYLSASPFFLLEAPWWPLSDHIAEIRKTEKS